MKLEKEHLFFQFYQAEVPVVAGVRAVAVVVAMVPVDLD
jgi:hypothetical protein